MRFKPIQSITFIFLASTFFSSCLPIPVYKDQPILPPVSGIVKDALTNEVIENAQVYWLEPAGYYSKAVYSGKDGSFHLDRIEKYFTWRVIAMDPGWGGELIATKQGYMKEKIHLGGMGYPNYKENIEIKLKKIQ